MGDSYFSLKKLPATQERVWSPIS